MGSGKSSLAFDTIYAEGQRRYVESLSAYAASSWADAKPDVDHIEGLSPAISIEQKTTSKKIRARPWARSRRSMIICGPLSRGWACLIRPPPAFRKPDRQPDGRPNSGAD
jgi:hypothetical protein